MKVVVVAGLTFSAAGISEIFLRCACVAVLRRHSVCEAIQTQAGTQDNTLAEDEILSAITDSNGPSPETAKTYQ